MNLTKEQFLSWEHGKNELPPTIRYSSEYQGQDDLRIACTQLGISQTKQKKVVQEWIELLPSLKHVKHLWFYSRVPQELFNSATEMPQLRSLFLKWSGNGVTDLENIGKLELLERLYIGSCTQIETLNSLKGLSELKWLEMHELKKINDITGISALTNLIGLIFTGGMFGKQCLDNIAPIAKLSNLEYLDFYRLKVESGDISPITQLKALKYLNIPIYYPMNEYAKIYAALPNCDHGIYAYRKTGEKCEKCESGELVLPMDKGKRALCTVCKPDKIKKLIEVFSSAVVSYS